MKSVLAEIKSLEQRIADKNLNKIKKKPSGSHSLPSYFYKGNSVSESDVHAALKEIGKNDPNLMGDDLADRFNHYLGHLQTIVYRGEGNFTVT